MLCYFGGASVSHQMLCCFGYCIIDFIGFLNLTKENEAAADALPVIMSVEENHHLDLCYHLVWGVSLHPFLVVRDRNFRGFISIKKTQEDAFCLEISFMLLQITPAEVVAFYWTSLHTQGSLKGICGRVQKPLNRCLEVSPGPLCGQVM